jgi:fluoroacetyl-CoA thioesterase
VPQAATPLKPGLVGTAGLVVAEEHTAPRLGSGRAPVLATPIMVALMEGAAVDCVERGLPDGQETLGVRVEVEHIAATPVGMRVTARAELTEIDGRALVFKVEARDEREIIGKGRHVRVLVDTSRFRAKVGAKGAGR